MTCKEALELNESKRGLYLESLTNYQIAAVLAEIPGWEYPLAYDCLAELAKRARVDMQRSFSETPLTNREKLYCAYDVLSVVEMVEDIKPSGY